MEKDKAYKTAGMEWVERLLGNPKAAEECDWDTLWGSDWCRLLVREPQYADRCAWWKLRGGDWVELLGGASRV